MPDPLLLIHGLGSGPLWMRALARRLRRQGHQVLLWSYPSVVGSLQQHGKRLRDELRRLDEEPSVERFHLVTHSMGGAVARVALTGRRPAKLGRIVMLAPPNRGTPVARVFGRLLRPLCPAVGQLSDRPGSFVRRLPRLEDVEVGIVSGRLDWMVPTWYTHLDDQADHTTLWGTHTSILFQRRTTDRIAEFLESGRFGGP